MGIRINPKLDIRVFVVIPSNYHWTYSGTKIAYDKMVSRRSFLLKIHELDHLEIRDDEKKKIRTTRMYKKDLDVSSENYCVCIQSVFILFINFPRILLDKIRV